MRKLLFLPLFGMIIVLLIVVLITHEYSVKAFPQKEIDHSSIVNEYEKTLNNYLDRITILNERIKKEEIKRITCEMKRKDLESNLNDTLGEIPLSTFQERVRSLMKYDPNIKNYLESESYRYHLNGEAKEKVYELIDKKSYRNTVDNIHQWVKNNIQYEYDRRWHTAEEAWRRRKSNCNGISFLTCGMLREAGIPCRVVGNSEHVWTEYLYIDKDGRIIWSIWDQGNQGFSVFSFDIKERELG